jgi:diguanylate cyclase (GGDEF)-like protein
MRKRIGIYGVTDEALALIPLLSANPGIEIVRTFDDDPEGVAARLAHVDPGVAALVEQTLTADAEEFANDASLTAVIGADADTDFNERFPDAAERGVQVVTALAARMLWGYATSAPSVPRPAPMPSDAESGPVVPQPPAPPPPPPRDERKAELLQALHEVVESYNLTIDTDELFIRMLEIALGVTEADGGSLMLIDPESGDLRIRVAVGIEPELWPKIRLRPGDGIAGYVADQGRPLRLRGRADRQRFRIVRERLDVESALSVPLIHQNEVLGVLNIHATSRPDAFTDADLEFAEELAHLHAQIIARAQEHEVLRSQAQRYEAVREVREIMAGREPLSERLETLCHFVADRVPGGIAQAYRVEDGEEVLRLAASSLRRDAGSLEICLPLGQGIDGAAAAARKPTFLWQEHGGFYAALPLVSAGVLAGLVTLQASTDTVRQHLEETLAEIAEAVAEELIHAERESRIAERANKAAAINEAGIRMISTTDPAEVLRLGTSEATMVLDSDHAVLRLQDEETRRFVIRSYFGSAEGHLQEQLFRLDKQVSVDVLRRRSPLLITDLRDEQAYASAGFEARSLIAAPLYREGQIIGTLALYDKISGDRIYPGAFDEEDVQLFTKFLSYLERAVTNALFYSKARQYRNFDEDTGLPNASYLAKRIQEEMARAGARQGALALAVARIENLPEIDQQGDPVKTRRIVKRVVDALSERSRDFDVIGRMADDEFMVLLPDPGASASDRVFELARAVAEDVSKDERLNDPVRISLAFGYASYPEDGHAEDELIEKAREPRIRMV